MTPEESRSWRAAGLDVSLIWQCVIAELSPAVAGEWWALGFRPEVIEQLLNADVSVDRARALKRELGTSAKVLAQVATF